MNQTKEEGCKRQTWQQQEEIDNLKQDSSSKNQLFENQSQIQSTEQQKQPKNFQTASIIDRGQQQNIAIISIISFIEQNMQTRKSFGEQLKIQLDTNLTQ